VKIVLVLLDGLGDRSYPVLGHRTPLEAADTPNLDRLAAEGCSGLYHATVPGQCLPSETAHYRLFGYPMEAFPGRGLLEAAGAGIQVDDRDVACVAHLFHAKPDVPGGPVLYRRSWKEIRASEAELEALYGALTPFEARGVCFQLHRIRGNDGVLVMSGKASPFVSDSDPMTRHMAMGRIVPLRPNPEPEEAARTAEALNAFLERCRIALASHPVNRDRIDRGLQPLNFLATQRCGRRVRAEGFSGRWGMEGLLIASGAVFGGIASELGMTFERVTDGNDPGDDLEARITMALKDTAHGFVHVHTKAPDEAAHRGDPEGKAAVIEVLDRGMAPLPKALRSSRDLLVAVTADHSTPCGSPLIHSGETVPFLIAGPGVRRDRVERFDEVSAAQGGLGLLRGEALMLTLLCAAGRSSLHGHRLGAEERAYVPGDYPPFLD